MDIRPKRMKGLMFREGQVSGRWRRHLRDMLRMVLTGTARSRASLRRSCLESYDLDFGLRVVYILLVQWMIIFSMSYAFKVTFRLTFVRACSPLLPDLACSFRSPRLTSHLSDATTHT